MKTCKQLLLVHKAAVVDIGSYSSESKYSFLFNMHLQVKIINVDLSAH